ncbi:MAG TPA: hypothetical protein QF873_03020, partial [Patescibacteria group bacterium]|nr:hypothetical protein [Patescibacteria group bacterium]
MQRVEKKTSIRGRALEMLLNGTEWTVMQSAKSWKRFEGDFLLALAFLGALSFYAGIGLWLVEIEENDPV